MEFHSFKNLYFLCIATKSQNFSIPSESYFKLASVYYAIFSQVTLKPMSPRSFETPSYVNKAELLRCQAVALKK